MVYEVDRVCNVLRSDMVGNPERVLPSLKNEIKLACKDYVNINGDVMLRYRFSDDGIIFFTEIHAKSIKNMFRL